MFNFVAYSCEVADLLVIVFDRPSTVKTSLKQFLLRTHFIAV